MTEDDVFSVSRDAVATGKVFQPQSSAEVREANYARWNDAVQRTLNMNPSA